MRLLIVDDDPSSRRLLRQIITSAEPGSEVIEACNGGEACILLERRDHGFDAVFLDLSMPDHHGIDLIGRFTADPALRNLSIVVCTSSNDRATVVNAVAAGARHYLVKPPIPALVADKLRLVKISLRAAQMPAAGAALAPVAAEAGPALTTV